MSPDTSASWNAIIFFLLAIPRPRSPCHVTVTTLAPVAGRWQYESRRRREFFFALAAEQQWLKLGRYLDAIAEPQNFCESTMRCAELSLGERLDACTEPREFARRGVA